MTHALLVDGTNILVRALHAAKDSMRVNGVLTGPTVIFFKMLSRVVSETGATHMVVAFDPEGSTYRHAFYPPYKAKRKPHMAEEREGPTNLTRLLLGLLEVEKVTMPGFEGDDVIASAWRSWRQEHPEDPVTIFSGDKDLLQLIDAQTTVLRPTTGALERWDREKVLGHYGVPPEALATYLGLVGDVSDNVPGARGVGAKKARRLIEEHGSVFTDVIDVLAASSRFTPDDVETALISYLLVDLRGSTMLPGAVAATEFPREPEVSDVLRLVLDEYLLRRLRDDVERGTLWGAAPECGDDGVLLALEDLDPTHQATEEGS